ncbi:hypothetical protein [Psychroflexus sp. ALD_RP9]|uniref:hypothetical protein n=1 Tax=Psychroflexus sp. ALD_RP9 TaxID=2777186 RepID=UPI001A8C16ED|nr:hypothetical protein [Psychroflexus sp. ALD_RP9]QSS97071.1 hypothetical protein IMZ30_11605 [Psychroflexus sp. ALD_RP9]
MRLFKLHISFFLAGLMLILISSSLSHLLIFKHEFKPNASTENSYTEQGINHYCSHFVYNALSNIQINKLKLQNDINYILKPIYFKENKRATRFKKYQYGRDPPFLKKITTHSQ